MADNDIPAIPVPPVEPAPAAPRSATPAPEAAAVMPPLVDLTQSAAQGVPPAEPSTLPAAPPVQSNPYAQQNPYAQPAPSAQPNPYAQQNPYAQPAPYVQPNPYAQPTAHSAGAAYSPPPAYGAQPYAQGGYYQEQPKGLAIASMSLGIAGFFINGFLGLGFLFGVAAIITGHLAQRRQPHARGFWITGLITGYIAAIVGLLIGLFFVFGIALSYNDGY